MVQIALWQFASGGAATDEVTSDGAAQDGSYENGASAVNGQLVLDGQDDYALIPADDAFQLDQGTLVLEFSPDTVHRAGVFSRDSDMSDDGGHFTLWVTGDGEVEVRHQTPTSELRTSTPNDFYSAGDELRVTYSWNADGSGGEYKVENLTQGTEYSEPTPGNLTWDMGADYNEPIVLGADQIKSGDNTADNLRQFFDGTIEYVSLFDTVVDPGGPRMPQGAVEGTAGNDVIDAAYLGDPQGDRVDNGDGPAGADDDTVIGGAGDDSIDGGMGDDTLLGGAGDDSIFGGWSDAGDDSISAGDGNDLVLGGDGNDTVTGGDGADWIAGDTMDDALFGGAGSDRLVGGTGNDTLVGGTGNDLLTGGAGNDSLSGGDDADEIRGAGGDTVIGGEGGNDNDTLNVSGVDFITSTGAESGTVHFLDGTTLDYSQIEQVNVLTNDFIVSGTAGDDVMGDFYSDSDGDWINNQDGADGTDGDSVRAGAGNDEVWAGEGNDTVSLGSGSDFAGGGSGDDSITGGDGITGNGDDAGGDDTIRAGSGNDTVRGEDGDDRIDGQRGADSLSGDAGNDVLEGGDGNDTLEGGDGDDTLSGGRDADRLDGGAGNDVISFGAGDDVQGGDGDDRFVLTELTGDTPANITITGGEGGETQGDTLVLNSGVTQDDITFTNTDDAAGGLSGSFTTADGSVVKFDEIENIICFTPGARILTARGERPIETLRVGDRVVTRDHGVRPICWIGARTVPGVGRLAPIRVAPGVSGAGSTGLLVSPQHRLLFTGYRAELLFGESEVLVAAKHLIDGVDVCKAPQAEVTYIHIMFDRHEVIYADGIATESFYAGDAALDAVDARGRAELFEIFPELRSAGDKHRQAARKCLKVKEAKLLAAFIADGNFGGG